MTPITVIERLSTATKRAEKEQILMDAFMQGHREFFIAANLAFDTLITFGVEKVPEITGVDDGQDEFTFTEFLNLANRLRIRELTGHAAKEAMRDAAERCDFQTWNSFYRRVLLKDLKCGVDASIINKVLKKLAYTQDDALGLIIPLFSVQQANDGDKQEYAKKITGRKMLDVKLEGIRLITVLDKDSGTVIQYTKVGKINGDFPDIRAGLRSLLNDLPASIVLDGEVISSNLWELMKEGNQKDTTKTQKLAVFDIIPLREFKAGYCKIPQELRHAILTDMEVNGDFLKHTKGLVYVLPKITVDLNTPEGQLSFEEFKESVSKFKAIIVKDPGAPYETKRSSSWLTSKIGDAKVFEQ